MLVCCYALPLLSSCLLICVFVYCFFSRLGPASCDVNPLLSRLPIEYVPTPKAVTRAKIPLWEKLMLKLPNWKWQEKWQKGWQNPKTRRVLQEAPTRKVMYDRSPYHLTSSNSSSSAWFLIYFFLNYLSLSLSQFRSLEHTATETEGEQITWQLQERTTNIPARATRPWCETIHMKNTRDEHRNTAQRSSFYERDIPRPE